MLSFVNYLSWCKLNGLKASDFKSLKSYFENGGGLC